MLKVMGTAIVVGGVGVLLLVDTGNTKHYVKDANMLAVALGATLFGVGMVVCIVRERRSAWSRVPLSFDWPKAHVLNVWADFFGKRAGVGFVKFDEFADDEQPMLFEHTHERSHVLGALFRLARVQSAHAQFNRMRAAVLGAGSLGRRQGPPRTPFHLDRPLLRTIHAS